MLLGGFSLNVFEQDKMLVLSSQNEPAVFFVLQLERFFALERIRVLLSLSCS